jgi:hypothetical protein
MLHDEPEDPVDVLKIVKSGLRVDAVAAPDESKPLPGLDRVGQTNKPAMKPSSSSSNIASSPRASRRRLRCRGYHCRDEA